MRRRLLLFLTLVALTVPASAGAADWPSATLNATAGTIAGHPVRVYCENDADEWAQLTAANNVRVDPGSIEDGFTWPFGPPVIYLSPLVCDSLHELLAPGRQDLADVYWGGRTILAFLHESVHQRGIVDEAVTDCTALALIPSYSYVFGIPQTIATTTTRRIRVRRHHRKVWRTVVSTVTTDNPAYAELVSYAEMWHHAKPAEYQGNC